MKAYIVSALVGLAVGVVYAALDVKSPAPPLVALLGLLGMLVGEALGHMVGHLLRAGRGGGPP